MPPFRGQASLSQIGEFRLIQSITRKGFPQGIRPIIGIGDDAAVLPNFSPDHIVLSTDLLIEHIHFSRSSSTFYDIGYKAAAVNLSDIAAMGATPTSILVSIALPPRCTLKNWKELYRGLAVPCKAQNVQLIGGDTSSSPSTIFIAITILGHIKVGLSLTRNRAKVDDLIFVSGTLGDSAAGLEYLKQHTQPIKPSRLAQPMKFLVTRHLRPTPRLALGQLLATRRLASAALDISDGLSGDLAHLCRQSQVGALIQSTQIPLSPQLIRYAAKKKQPSLPWALHGEKITNSSLPSTRKTRDAYNRPSKSWAWLFIPLGSFARSDPASNSKILMERAILFLHEAMNIFDYTPGNPYT